MAHEPVQIPRTRELAKQGSLSGPQGPSDVLRRQSGLADAGWTDDGYESSTVGHEIVDLTEHIIATDEAG
jgi:hypothetical protein